MDICDYGIMPRGDTLTRALTMDNIADSHKGEEKDPGIDCIMYGARIRVTDGIHYLSKARMKGTVNPIFCENK